MRCRCKVVVLAAAAATGWIAAGAWAQQQSKTPTLSTPSDVAAPAVSATQPDLNLGVSPRSPDKTDIQNLLAEVVQAATTPGQLPKVVSFLSKADRDAIGNLSGKTFSDLDARCTSLQLDWQAKFGIDLRLVDKQSVIFGDETFPVRPGSEAEENPTTGITAGSARGSVHRLKGPATQPSSGQLPAGDNAELGGAGSANGAGANVPPGGGPSGTPSGGEGDMGGKDLSDLTAALNGPVGTSNIGQSPTTDESLAVRTATVQLPATAHHPSRFLHLVNEGTTHADWKIDLPASGLTIDKLQASLLRHLTYWDTHRAYWPTEINEAYQAASREVLSALIQAGGE